MLIRPVAHSPHLPLVAAWLHAEWWAAGGHALAETAAFLHRATGPGLPCALVAERDGVALGTATLDAEDLPSRPDLSPWLASVLVAPEFRRQGVATALVAEVRRRAAALAYPRLWLFTGGQAAFYASLGWAPEGEDRYRGQPVTLMSCVP
ncbi:GNAT family N-acetyltransferase [Falsiroseomonas sp.]|uniref:GNAT family N-acetyltransferase n=1 Tax=Falsiroseomonas sp. TaxID=2870721 RepID=UPI0027197C2C|nr:GNAT family N-acetyltransferase [Falsiroseomonas sp.]MDO9498568.1 GNAT family N-acetyltransferase [Falsiroseomonas sp.]